MPDCPRATPEARPPVGELAGHRWRIDVAPLNVAALGGPAGALRAARGQLRMQAPGGPAIQITTVRLRAERRGMSAHDAPSRRSGPVKAGFTLIEVLMATLLMTVILAALATVTAQWLPNWNRGMARVQRAERLAIGLERSLADLSVAEMIPSGGDTKRPLFEGSRIVGHLRADGGWSQRAPGPGNHPADREGRRSGPCVGA